MTTKTHSFNLEEARTGIWSGPTHGGRGPEDILSDQLQFSAIAAVRIAVSIGRRREQPRLHKV
jgi:hypothetical protein